MKALVLQIMANRQRLNRLLDDYRASCFELGRLNRSKVCWPRRAVFQYLNNLRASILNLMMEQRIALITMRVLKGAV